MGAWTSKLISRMRRGIRIWLCGVMMIATILHIGYWVEGKRYQWYRVTSTTYYEIDGRKLYYVTGMADDGDDVFAEVSQQQYNLAKDLGVVEFEVPLGGVDWVLFVDYVLLLVLVLVLVRDHSEGRKDYE